MLQWRPKYVKHYEIFMKMYSSAVKKPWARPEEGTKTTITYTPCFPVCIPLKTSFQAVTKIQWRFLLLESSIATQQPFEAAQAR